MIRYLAAKTYYFGVGGSLRQFETVLHEDGALKSEVCWRSSSGKEMDVSCWLIEGVEKAWK